MKKILYLTVFLLILCVTASCSDMEEGAAVNVPVSEIVSDSEAKTTSVTEVAETIESQTETEPEPIIKSEPEIEKTPENITVSICAAGDNLIHSPIYVQAESPGTDNKNKYDFGYAYSNLSETIASYDLALINQETLICNDIYEPSNYPYFNSPSALGDYMINMGFKVFSIANNHTLDQGVEGLSACLDYWESKDNVLSVGAYRNKDDRTEIRINEINGIVFSYLSYTEHLNGLILPADSEFEIGDAKDIETMTAEIRKAKDISDVCAVFLHWGVEGSDMITGEQRSIAKILADAGADIILGTHPHVLRDIEYIERQNGSKALCAYSLGNFISAQNIPQTMIGGVLTFDVSVFAETRGVQILNVIFIPTVTHYDYNYRNLRIYRLQDYTAELANAHGVREYGDFSLEYIHKIVNNSISAEFLINQ